MWNIPPTTQWERDHNYYDKNHPRELAALLNNLTRYLSLINCSPNAKSAFAGYLHFEAAGVVAIDQKGGGPNLQETRMYTYADEAQKMLYLITIGNKNTQRKDVQFSKNFVNDTFPKSSSAE